MNKRAFRGGAADSHPQLCRTLLLKGRMPRLQGALMMAVYIAYIVFLALNL
jgi:Ca2+/Na+ antiporter